MKGAEFFIDNAAIEAPLNVRGFYLFREVSERFNGSVYDKVGRVSDEINSIIFKDPDAVEIIKGLKASYLTEARADLLCLRNGRELFKANIDFLSISSDRKGNVTASLNDPDADIFIKNIDKKYSLEPTGFDTFSSETVYTDYALMLDADKLEINISQASQDTPVSPIFKSDNKATLTGSLLETEDSNGRPFYKNSTGYKIRLNMDIAIIGDISASGLIDLESKLLIKDTNGSIVYDLTMTTIPTFGLTSFAIIDQYSLDVPVDANVSILLRPKSGTVSTLQVKFNAESVINLSEGDLSNINIPVISANDAMAQLINKASAGILSYIPFAGLDHLRFSSYSSVRGRESSINISFGDLWDGLNSEFCLKLSKVGTSLKAESFVDSFDTISAYEVKKISDYTIDTDIDHLYNSISSGFSEWKPKNDSGKPESTAPLSMSSKLLSASSELILTQNNFIASLKVLSEAYLMRNKSGSENENDDLDQRIFLLSVDPKKPINSLTSIENWLPIIGNYHLELTKESGEGLYMNEDVVINLRGKPAIFTPDKIALSCNINTEDFEDIGDFISFTDMDKNFLVYIVSATHYPFPGDSENGNTTIIGRLINTQNA